MIICPNCIPPGVFSLGSSSSPIQVKSSFLEILFGHVVFFYLFPLLNCILFFANALLIFLFDKSTISTNCVFNIAISLLSLSKFIRLLDAKFYLPDRFNQPFSLLEWVFRGKLDIPVMLQLPIRWALGGQHAPVYPVNCTNDSCLK